MNNKENKIGFTLIELIIVLAIVAVLAAILITIIRPQQIFQNLRDTQRMSDLKNLANAINLYMTDMQNKGQDIVLTPSGTVLTFPNGQILNKPNDGCRGGATPTIFYSTANLGNVLLPFGFEFSGARATTTRTVATSTTGNPPGWLPVPIATSSLVQLPSLPIDPRNSSNASTPNSFYYTFACNLSDLSFELNARLEIKTNEMQNDGGDVNSLYEVGTNLTILPTTTYSFFYP
jgi:prepilin-type N-terminal cleavage/methylation domain-containing protein